MQKIFEDYGIEIFVENGHYYIQYAAGELVDHIIEIEVSEEEAIRAQKSEEDAYHVILEQQGLGASEKAQRPLSPNA